MCIPLHSGFQTVYAEGGALRRSEPIGPKGVPMYLCPWHAGAAIRTGVGNDQLQTRYGWVAVARLGEDYSSGAKGWDYDEPGRSGPIDCARPHSPELQGGKSFIMY